jgi:hypothetical protein
MKDPSGLADTALQIFRVLRAITVSSAVTPAVRAAAADALVECPGPEEISKWTDNTNAQIEQLRAASAAVEFLLPLDSQSSLDQELHHLVTHVQQCLQMRVLPSRRTQWMRGMTARTGTASSGQDRVGSPTAESTSSVESVVELARARVGNTFQDEHRRQAQATASLLHAYACGELLGHIAEHGTDPLLLWALPQHPDLLLKVRDAANRGGTHAAIFHRVTAVIDWRSR